MALGEHPVVGLSEVRERYLAARKKLASGIDPVAERKTEADTERKEAEDIQRQYERSFERVARERWSWWSKDKSPRHAEILMNRLEADVFPPIRHLFVDAIEPGQTRDIILSIETRGASDMAKRAHQSIGQIFRFAIARDLATRNPQITECSDGLRYALLDYKLPARRIQLTSIAVNVEDCR